MTKNTILIIEDDMALAIKMEIHLTEWGYDVIGISKNGEEALGLIYEKKPVVILMDINLEGYLSGIEIAERIIDLDISIIFMTIANSNDLYEAAKKVKGISYLVKPFEMLTLKGAIEMSGKVRPNPKINLKTDSTIFLRRGQQTIPVDIDSILWLKADRNYCDIFTSTNGRFSVRKSLIKFIKDLPPEKIVKIHRQYAISINQVESVFLTKKEVLLKNGEILPFGRTYKEELLRRLKKDWGKSNY